MKTALRTSMALLAMAAPALAAEGGATNGVSLLVILFLVMGALIVVFQLIPALLLFYATLRGLFSRMPNKSTVKMTETARKG